MRIWANNAKSTLASSVSDVASTLTLETGEGGKFPSPAGDEFFDVTITQGGNLETSYEICRCTGRSGDVLTIERGAYGTSAASWDAGSKVEIRIHAAAMGDFATLGYVYVGHWGASALIPTETDGCAAAARRESTTNGVMVEYCAFDAAGVESAQFSFKAPSGLDVSSGFSAVVEYEEGDSASSHGVVFEIKMQAQGDGDTVDSAWGSAVTKADTSTAGTRRFTDVFSTITPGGTWAAGDTIIVNLSRLVSDAGDTMDVDANVISVTLYGTLDNSTEA